MKLDMSSVKNLVDLPTEVLQRVLLWTLFIDAQAELALLLTCKLLKEQTECAANTGAWKYAIEHYGTLATMMFAPGPDQNLPHDWLPRLEKIMERIDELLNGIRAHIDVYSELQKKIPEACASKPCFRTQQQYVHDQSVSVLHRGHTLSAPPISK